jgi:hypothetical protein
MFGKCIMEPVRKKDVAVLITRAHRPGTTGIDGYSRLETSFPQGQWESALLRQENAIMSPQEHDNDAATAGFALWMFPTFGTVSWRYGAIFGLWRDS